MKFKEYTNESIKKPYQDEPEKRHALVHTIPAGYCKTFVSSIRSTLKHLGPEMDVKLVKEMESIANKVEQLENKLRQSKMEK
jgi:hypothetical protein